MTDRRLPRRPLEDVVAECLAAGLRAVQLREKDLPVRDLLALAGRLREMTRRHGARLLVNDRADVALAVGADGVQRTGQSLPVAALRGLGGPGFLVGASVHSAGEARQAETEGADFLLFGPVYDTPAKRPWGPPQGLGALGAVVRRAGRPVLAIGGLTPARVPEVLGVGAAGVAVISAILGAERPGEATAAFIEALGRA